MQFVNDFYWFVFNMLEEENNSVVKLFFLRFGRIQIGTSTESEPEVVTDSNFNIVVGLYLLQ